MYGIGLIIWCVIAIALAGALSRLIKSGWTRRITFLVLVPVVFLLPLIDELLGKFQYDKLCKDAEQVKISGTIPVREPFYTSEGRWRRSKTGPLLANDDTIQIEQAYEALVRYDNIGPTRVSITIPIDMYEVRIVNRRSSDALASFRIYATRGGWLSRQFETPTIVRAQCLPSAFGEKLDQEILPFDQRLGDKK
jgi:hypothetical protein